jgi:hypothetical protein
MLAEHNESSYTIPSLSLQGPLALENVVGGAVELGCGLCEGLGRKKTASLWTDEKRCSLALGSIAVSSFMTSPARIRVACIMVNKEGHHVGALTSCTKDADPNKCNQRKHNCNNDPSQHPFE